jgi:hypothetical protein
MYWIDWKMCGKIFIWNATPLDGEWPHTSGYCQLTSEPNQDKWIKLKIKLRDNYSTVGNSLRFTSKNSMAVILGQAWETSITTVFTWIKSHLCVFNQISHTACERILRFFNLYAECIKLLWFGWIDRRWTGAASWATTPSVRSAYHHARKRELNQIETNNGSRYL